MRTCVLGFWILVVAVTSATAQERARIRPLTPRPTIQDSISQRPTLLPEVVRSGKVRVVRIPKTTLEIQRHSGEFAEWSYTWTFSSPQSLRFRWATQEAGVEKGMWQVSDQPFAGDDIAPDGLIRWGSIAQVPALGKVSVFDINFTQFAPSSPPSSPRKYYVRVIPFGSGWDPAGAPSLPVTVNLRARLG
jgi:hypothetical protein